MFLLGVSSADRTLVGWYYELGKIQVFKIMAFYPKIKISYIFVLDGPISCRFCTYLEHTHRTGYLISEMRSFITPFRKRVFTPKTLTFYNFGLVRDILIKLGILVYDPIVFKIHELP